MKKLIVILLFVTSLCSGQIRLSDRAEISVLTLGPWQGEVYTAFGHSAFRVYDPIRGIDAAFNYGVFDYDRPGFYLNFARGQNIYQLGVMDYKAFEYSYIYYNRYIHEQILNLSVDQKQRLFDFLQWNARPENKEYLYDYFYDNCATKIPEVMLKVFGDSVIFDGSHITTKYSIRELTDLYLEEQPWGDLGIDVCLGLPTDKIATPYEYMFLPDYVEKGFANASIINHGIKEPLVLEARIIYSSTPEDLSPGFFNPLTIFFIFLLAVIAISYRDLRRKKLLMAFDVFLFAILGLLGIVLVLLWTATSHQAAARNFNLLWAIPFHLVAVIFFTRQPRWLAGYFYATMIICALLLVSWPFLPQKLHYSLVPFVVAIGLRAYTQYRIRSQAV